MSDNVFRCDYCGKLANLDKAEIYFELVQQLEDGRWLHAAAVYCSTYCGRTATTTVGSGRG